MTFGTIFLIMGLMTILLFQRKLSRSLKRQMTMRKYGCKEPPRPDIDLNNIISISAKNNHSLRTATELFEQHGKTYKTTRGGRVLIRTCDPEVSKAVLSTHFSQFGLQPIRYEGGKSFFGNGMLVLDGAHWKDSRAMIRPTFDIAHITDLDRLRPFVDDFMRLLPQDGSTIDLFPLLKRLVCAYVDGLSRFRKLTQKTLDVSSDFIFGRSMDSLASPEHGKEFMDHFQAALRDVVIPDPAMRSDEHYQGCQEVWNYIDARIEEAFTRVKGASGVANNGNDTKHVRIIDELVKICDDRTSLRFLILSIFMPAHDNVAVVVSNTFFHLARSSNSWDKLRAEILAHDGSTLTYESLVSFKYLRWVLQESEPTSIVGIFVTKQLTFLALRLTPLNSGTLRECLQTTVLPVGGGPDGHSPLLVEEKDLIEVHFRSQHYDKSFWGNDAHEFRPERWSTIRPTWEYIPFSGGPRICPALKMVYAEAEYIMARIIKRFSQLENRDTVLEWVEERRLTFQSRNGAKVALIV